MEGNKITDSEILSNVIEALGLSQHSLSQKLEYKSPASVYHVVNGVNTLSSGMIDRIMKKYTNVSYKYLTTGEGPILLSGEELQTQMNLFNNVGQDLEFEFLKKLARLPERLDAIEETLELVMKKLSELNK